MKLGIVAQGICCAVGHHSKAASAAIRARMNHFRETEFIDDSGMPIVGAGLFGLEQWGEARLHTMFHAVLSECSIQLPAAANNHDCAILLLCAETQPSDVRHTWADHMLDRTLEAGQFHAASDVMALGKAGIVPALQEAQRLFSLPQPPSYVIIAGVDNYLDAAVIDGMLQQQRLATSSNSDGFIPGEAAAAIVLINGESKHSAQQRTAMLWIEGIGEGQEPARISGNSAPRAQALCQAMRAAAIEAQCQIADLHFHASGFSGEAWYAREIGLALSRVLEKRVANFRHHIVSQFVGEVGAACAPLCLAWLAHAMPRHDGPGQRGLLHFANDDGLRAALVVRHGH